VPGYEGIAGNEMKDQLARTGSEHLFIGSESACSISIELPKKAVRDWTNIKKKHWESVTGPKEAKGLIVGSLC
jgi:hypothetical protein